MDSVSPWYPCIQLRHAQRTNEGKVRYGRYKAGKFMRAARYRFLWWAFLCLLCLRCVANF